MLWYDVWNEFKGIPWTNNTGDVQYMLGLYNAVYDALKSVNPAIKVGGPYLPVEGSGTDATQWWGAAPLTSRSRQTFLDFLAGVHGMDFISFDRGVFDPHDPTIYTPDQAMLWSKNFEDIARKLHVLTGLPIVCAETYFYGDQNPDLQETAAGYASVLYHLLKGGASIALQWQPHCVAPTNGGPANGSEFGSLFSDTRVVGGGQLFPAYYAWKAFHDIFPPGTTLYNTTSSSPTLLALSSGTHTLLINQQNAPITVGVNGLAVTLNPYQVRVL